MGLLSNTGKLIERFEKIPKDFKYSDLKKMLSSFGFKEYSKGKTSGSRVKFYDHKNGIIILLNKPHPGNIVGLATLKAVKNTLQEGGYIK